MHGRRGALSLFRPLLEPQQAHVFHRRLAILLGKREDGVQKRRTGTVLRHLHVAEGPVLRALRAAQEVVGGNVVQIEELAQMAQRQVDLPRFILRILLRRDAQRHADFFLRHILVRAQLAQYFRRRFRPCHPLSKILYPTTDIMY